ncbi:MULTISPECIES: hypothetical protein [unclassified Bradyrhizobium]|uniref:hypothetical protein n=1 Tax=unclassified Bradyrhizobium TaxID=2631580 RepID=UPI001FF271A6|nr:MULTISPECIES: hypothetical protein [unclassified Bradyrhizobium]MCJ9705676.1 hypothetical protein [Bradyrhizobium sp. SHOUNA76]MCJ9729430.1 hypothetical protein [Bradyrhizobium sp. PRIMUS42]
MKQLQLIQILSINAEMLAQRRFHAQTGRALTRVGPLTTHEKGGVRIAEAAFEAGNAAVLASSRFTAR